MKSTSMIFAVTGMLLLFLNVNPYQASAQTTGGTQQVGACKPSPTSGTLIDSQQDGDYVGVAVVQKAKGEGCDGCSFKIKFLIGIIGTDSNGNPDTTRVPNPSRAYYEWHPDTGAYAGNNITWTEGDASASGNSSVKVVEKSMDCGGDPEALQVSVETNSPISPTPNSNPGAAKRPVKLEWTISLQCDSCSGINDSTILDTTIYEHKYAMEEEFGSPADDLQFTVLSGARTDPELRITANPKLVGVGYHLRVLSLSGKQVHSQSGAIPANNAPIALRSASLATGIYIATLQLSGGATYNTRFVVTE